MTVAIIAPGQMGSEVGKALSSSGIRTITTLVGRSEESRARAIAAGFEVVNADETLVEEADFLLSIVPPSQAVGVAQRFLPALKAAKDRPVYVDCNAVSPNTATRIKDLMDGVECRMLDAVLFGGPTSMKPGVIIHVSGDGAQDMLQLAGPELTVQTIDGPVGAASALKLCFAGINKGYIALGAAMFSMAQRAGCADSLVQQLSVAHSGVLDYILKAVPPMLPKAYRWDGEMNEIAQFIGPEEPMAKIFADLAHFYRDIGSRNTTGKDAELIALTEFFGVARSARKK